MNKIILTGNLCRDPEINTTSNGTAVCKLSIAVQRKFKNADGEHETDFFNITAWRGLAENCSKYLEKGKKILITGEMQSRNYEAQDGTKRTAWEVNAEDIEFLTPKNANSDTAPKTDNNELTPIDDDTLPF